MTRHTRIILLVAVAGLALLLGIGASLTTAQVGPTFGTNWFGQFFVGTTFGPAPVASNISYPNGLNFNWPGSPTLADGTTPVTGVPPDNFSARFTSAQTFQQGAYTFALNVDDQATVFVGGTSVFSATVPGNYSFTVTIPTAGTYAVQVDFVELIGTAILQFSWQLGTTTPGLTGTAAPTGPIASVVNVRGLALRTGPYLGASYIGVLRPNIAYSVIGRSNDEGGSFTWYQINTGERTGWASGRYLTLQVDPNTIPVVRTVFESIDGAPDVGAVAIPRAIMNLRRRPSIRSQRLAQVPWGAELVLIGRTVQGGNNFWLQVRYGNLVGWIYAPYVTVRGNVNGVPIR